LKPGRDRTAACFAASYLFLFFLSGAYAVWRLVRHTAASEFSGLPALVLTLPWSVVLSPVFHKLGYDAWYASFTSESPALFGFWAMVGLLPSAFLNAAGLYFVGRLVATRRRADGSAEH
jgi:hypothetical protein